MHYMIKEDLLRIYESSFARHWELPAIADYTGGEAVTYGELARRIAMVHLTFKKLGIRRGDKVAVLGRNSVAWITAYMATVTYGAVVVPVLQDFNPQDAQHIINHSDSVLLYINEQLCEHLDLSQMPRLKAAISLDDANLLTEACTPQKPTRTSSILKGIPHLFERTYPGGFGPADIDYANMPKDALMEINYTSGTTGFSKGVMLTYNNLCGNVVFGIDSQLYAPGDRCLTFLPLAHAYGCAFDMLTPLVAGASVTVLGKTPTPPVLLKAFAQVRPTLILCVPLILEKIYRRSILPKLQKPSVKRMLAIPGVRKIIKRKICNSLVKAFGGEFSQIIVGGAPLNPEVEQFLRDIRFPFTVGYGMTECGPLISYTYWQEFVPASCGRTIPQMQSRIDSPDPENVPGEICVRGENVMAGYYKNPQATNDVLDKDGWLHTGDMGTRTADGTLSIKGRSKAMILSATGQNIYPEEIEAKLNNLPFVSESLVVERGKHLVALVYPDYEAMDRAHLSLSHMQPVMEKVRTELNTLVAPYERIDYIQIHPSEFIKTPKRSIKRFLYS